MAIHDNGTQKSRVLIVDDHPAIRDALEQVINDQHDMMVCGSASSVQEALRLTLEIRPDVAVVDLVLQDSHGLDLAHALATSPTGVDVLVYSMHDERVYAERVLRAGGRGYIMKSEPTSRVVDSIRQVRRGEVSISPSMAHHMLNNMSFSAKRKSGFSLDKLTDRELEVFQMLGQGSTVDDICRELGLSRKTVETYRRRAKDKLGFSSVEELLQYALRYVFNQRGDSL